MNSDSWGAFLIDLEKNNYSHVVVPLLKQTSFSSALGDTMTIQCDNFGMKFFLETRKVGIEEDFTRFLGHPVRINFIIKEKVVGRKRKIETPLLQFAPTSDDFAKRAGLQEKFTFTNFAVSGSNQIAFAAAQAISESPTSIYNPLFVYGGVGVGKTHLAQAIGNKILEKDPSKKVIYCSSEDFTNDLIESIRAKNMQIFRKKYRNLNILIIDDVQFIAGKNSAQEEFFHTFNSLIRHGGQIILTSDQPPKSIKNLEDRLRSRFSGGLTIDVQNPDFELRTAILLIKARERNISIDIEVAKIIAEKVEDTRELEGKLLEIYTRVLKDGVKVTPEMVGKEFFRQQTHAQQKISPAEVMHVVCTYYGIKPSQIKNPSRKENIVLPRQIIMFILRNVLKLKLDEIAFILKRKDHTTIIHGVDKVTKLTLNNPNFKDEVYRLINSLTI